MTQQDAWEREYKNPKLVTLGEEPRKDLTEFITFLRRKRGVDVTTLRVLDLGTGTGRNALYMAELGNSVIGFDISKTAIAIAKERARAANVSIDYRVHDMGSSYNLPSGSCDLVLDVMSSNSLSESARGVYLQEVSRVLRPGGWFFYRGLCKDGDTNAKNLIKLHPGKEHDTYVIPEMGLTERVFTESDFRKLYGAYFTIDSLEKKATTHTSTIAHINVIILLGIYKSLLYEKACKLVRVLVKGMDIPR